MSDHTTLIANRLRAVRAELAAAIVERDESCQNDGYGGPSYTSQTTMRLYGKVSRLQVIETELSALLAAMASDEPAPEAGETVAGWPMSDQTVSVPLSRLRVMPKAGSPAILEGIRPGFILHYYTQDVMFVSIMAHPSGGVTYTEPATVPRSALALDLSAPTTASIDGATVAATMLAEAAGLDVSRGVTWIAERIEGGSYVRAFNGGGRSAVFDGPPTDAADPRAILAAVLVAVLGVAS